jgi:hypothetical protein
MCENLKTYDFFSEVPKEAQRTITSGRLKGKTDINPMWRIKVLTEKYGVCGFGWKYVIREKRMVEGANGVICAFVDIDLFVKEKGEWSEAIQGTGGSTFVAKENSGLYTSDECYKMALTDAISVACKALGVGANVYWEAGRSKYTQGEGESDVQNNTQPGGQNNTSHKPITARKRLIRLLKEKGINADEYAAEKNLTPQTTEERFEELIKELEG